MKITNRLNLPDALVRAITNDSYSAGHSDYTATGLLKPPQMAYLQAKHADEIEEDASDRIWSLIGQSVHTILERAGGEELKEKRVYAKFGLFVVSAQIDNLCLEHGNLADYKVTTSWKFRNNKPPDADYIAQLNIQCELLRQTGYTVNSLKIVGLLRDWSKLEARRSEDYPQSQVIVQNIPMWTREQAQNYIYMRIAAHERAKKEPVECSPGEMWERDKKYAVHKANQKRAMRLFDSLAIATEYANGQDFACDIVQRPGERIRCNAYCSVSKWCEQYQKYLNEKEQS